MKQFAKNIKWNIKDMHRLHSEKGAPFKCFVIYWIRHILIKMLDGQSIEYG